jgi:hypothetical protein
MTATPSNRRKHQRFPLASSVEIHLAATGKSYPGRGVDVSQGGMMVYLPASAPVSAGQELDLTVTPSPAAPAPAGVAGAVARKRAARVIRVDRDGLVKLGRLGVAVQFTNGQENPRA